MSNHTPTHSKMVRNALRKVARDQQEPYQNIRQEFIQGEDEWLAEQFWQALWKLYPDSKKYVGVNFCHGCKKFDLATICDVICMGNHLGHPDT